MKGKTKISEYFTSAKKGPKKKVSGQIERGIWLKMKEFAMYHKCPQAQVEQVMIDFVSDYIIDEHEKLMEDPEFIEWVRARRVRTDRKKK